MRDVLLEGVVSNPELFIDVINSSRYSPLGTVLPDPGEVPSIVKDGKHYVNFIFAELHAFILGAEENSVSTTYVLLSSRS